MVKHTPGPWTVLPGVKPGGGINIGPDLEGIGPHATVNFNGGESETNARLIAAAPELLEALRRIVAGWEVNGEGLYRGVVANQVRAAIKKAEGAPS